MSGFVNDILTVQVSFATKKPFLVSTLSREQIEIDMFFNGTEVLIFGTIHSIQDINFETLTIVMVMMGPRDRVRFQYERPYDHDPFVVDDVPGFYAVLSNRELEFLAPETLKQYEIGFDQIRLTSGEETSPQRIKKFREHLLQNMKSLHLYQEDFARIRFVEGRLFKAEVSLPARLPIGTYRITLYLFEHDKISDIQELSLNIEKIGWSRRIYSLAQHFPFLYGCLAIGSAVLLGWLSHRWFRVS